jgi:hypothetical protein
MICPVCEKYAVNRNSIGRSSSNTCGTDCSRIRNTVKTDKEARLKYLDLHEMDILFDRFTLMRPIPVRPDMGDEI